MSVNNQIDLNLPTEEKKETDRLKRGLFPLYVFVVI